MRNFVLGQEEVYKASPTIWSFKKVADIVNNINLRLSNMAGGFPFEFGGHTWKDSERLYLCGEFSDPTDEHLMVQNALLSATSGYAAKRFGKAHFRALVRPDFSTFRLQWMLFVVWQKCKGNADFRHLLLCIPRDITLVRDKTEDHSQSATLWGCRNMERHNREKRLWKDFSCRGDDQDPKEWRQKLNREREKLKNIGEWKGQNNMGKILMICRDCLVVGKEPPIDYDLLRQSNIYILGELLTFENN